jgi:hypothetical protein
MNQVPGKIGVVNAIDTYFDGALPAGMIVLAAHNLVDVIVDKAFGMIGMIRLSLGELG